MHSVPRERLGVLLAGGFPDVRPGVDVGYVPADTLGQSQPLVAYYRFHRLLVDVHFAIGVPPRVAGITSITRLPPNCLSIFRCKNRHH